MVGQRRDDAESSSAGVGLIYGAQSYVVDPRVAVSDVDCYFTVLALQRQFDRLGAVEDGIRDQLTRDDALNSRRAVELAFRDELFDKATRERRTLHVVRQRQGAGHGGRFLIERHPGRAVLRSGGPR